jgi:hypothetical protein
MKMPMGSVWKINKLENASHRISLVRFESLKVTTFQCICCNVINSNHDAVANSTDWVNKVKRYGNESSDALKKNSNSYGDNYYNYQAKVDGTYKWLLLSEFVNPDDSGTTQRTITVQIGLTIHKAETITETTVTNMAYTFDSEVSEKFSVSSIFSGGASSKYSYQYEVSQTLTDTTTLDSQIAFSYSDSITQTAGPGQTVRLYQLMYYTAGASYATRTFSETDEEVGDVVITYDVKGYLVGLNNLLNTLENIYPGSSNVAEWASIRNEIASTTGEPDVDRFKGVLVQFMNTYPTRDNQGEWAGIRDTSSFIYDQLVNYPQEARVSGRSDMQLFLYLVNYLTTIHPTRDNTAEWATIRDSCNYIYSHVVPIH